jgi:hypothetical protein
LGTVVAEGREMAVEEEREIAVEEEREMAVEEEREKAEVVLEKRSQRDCSQEAHDWKVEVGTEHWRPQELSC